MKLDPDQVGFHPLSGFDPAGRLFWWEGNLYRAISAERAAFYEHLLREGIVRDLVRRNLIIDTELTDLKLDGYSLVLKHRAVPFVSYCYEWCGEMLKAAALHVLRLQRELLANGLTVEQDAHPWNVLFIGPSPFWVDICALTPAGCGVQWDDMFAAYFSRPLKIMASGHERIARCLLREHFYGIEQREVEAIAGNAFVKGIRNTRTRAKAIAKKIIPSPLRPLAHGALQHLQILARPEAGQEPISRVEKAARQIENIRLLQPHSAWSTYDASIGFPDFSSTVRWTEKHRSILQILTAKKPASVLDIGSNRGWYSQLAARCGAQVVSIDSDEPSVTKLFVDVEKSGLSILPLVVDFHMLNPSVTWNGSPEFPAAERFCCDMVFALALVHHLVFMQHMKFDRIVTGLSAVARRWLVVEFVAREDGFQEWMACSNKELSWYNLNDFSTALSKKFRSITEFPSNKEHRRLLLCQR